MAARKSLRGVRSDEPWLSADKVTDSELRRLKQGCKLKLRVSSAVGTGISKNLSACGYHETDDTIVSLVKIEHREDGSVLHFTYPTQTGRDQRRGR